MSTFFAGCSNNNAVDSALRRELNEDAAQHGKAVSILAVDGKLSLLHMWDEFRSKAAEVANGLVERGNKVSFLSKDDSVDDNFVWEAMNTTVIGKVHLSKGKGNGNGDFNRNGSSNRSKNNYKKSRNSSIDFVSDATPAKKWTM